MFCLGHLIIMSIWWCHKYIKYLCRPRTARWVRRDAITSDRMKRHPFWCRAAQRPFFAALPFPYSVRSYPSISALNFSNHDSKVANSRRLPAAPGCCELWGFSGRFGERGREEDSGPGHSSGQDYCGDRAIQPGTVCRQQLHISGRGWPGPASGIHRSFGEPNISELNNANTSACNLLASFSLLAIS